MNYNRKFSTRSLRGKRLKGKGQGVLGARETRGAPATQASLPAKNDSAELFVQGALKLSVSSWQDVIDCVRDHDRQ